MSAEHVLTPPTEFCQNVTVSKPVGIRIHKDDCRITGFEPNSGLCSKADVGDIVIAVDNTPVNITTIRKRIKESKTTKVAMTIKHSTWSWCGHKSTTLERIIMDKDTEKITGRAIDLYYVYMKICKAQEISNVPIGFHVKYDSRERLLIVGTDKDSISAVHLRAGDIIREINDKPVASKTMLQFYLQEGIQNEGAVRLLIEAAAGGGDCFRDTVEMSPDVVEIATRQIEQMKKLNFTPKDCLKRVGTKEKIGRRVAISKEERKEVPIASDCDITKLKKCKGGNK